MESDLPGPSGLRILTRLHLYNIMQQQNLPSFDLKLEYVQKYILTTDHYSEEQTKEIKHNFSYLKAEFKKRWLAAHKKSDAFVKNNQDWLEKTFDLPKGVQRAGRPIKTFEGSSERTKRRKTAELRNNDENVLTHATQIKLQSSGKRDASKILKEITNSPTRAEKYRQAYAKAQKAVQKQLTPIQALSMFVEADFSRRQYEIVQGTNKKFYPCYSLLQKAKNECYPPKQSMKVTATSAEVNLQDLLDHTVTRLLNYLEELLNCVSEEERETFELICKWGCDGSRQQRKTEIQIKFREKTGLIVDVPKAGFGNTNDGNTSRRFFADPKLAAEITGIDFELIFRLKVILEVLSSGHEINILKFEKYAYKTAKLYVSLYSWHPMTPTLHKILTHSVDVINHALLPIGQLSEEASEARNKHFRQYRQNFARKFSRESCNQDVINRLLLTSDPLITSIRTRSKKRSEPFLKESLDMLLPTESLQKESSAEESSDEENMTLDE